MTQFYEVQNVISENSKDILTTAQTIGMSASKHKFPGIFNQHFCLTQFFIRKSIVCNCSNTFAAFPVSEITKLRNQLVTYFS